MANNLKGLMTALHQFINEAILESDDVAAAMAALKRTGKNPVFTIDITLEDAPECDEIAEAVEPASTHNAEDLVLSDADVSFLAELGISDPSWASAPRAA